MDTSIRTACIADGGEWVTGLTPLSSHCASSKPNTLPPHPPSETDILDQRNKEPPKEPINMKQVTDIARFRSHTLGNPDNVMIGLGPKDAKVTWPLCPGDVVWRAATADSPTDNVRRFGVYLGLGFICDLGAAQRAISNQTGHVYWKTLITDPEERATITSPATFTKGERLRCGVYNTTGNAIPRVETVLLAAACVGTLIRRLARPDAQHICAYMRTGVWLVEKITSSMVAPISFRGEFNNMNVAVKPSVDFTRSECVISASPAAEEGGIPDESPDSYIIVKCPRFTEMYGTVQLAEELYRQKRDVQPYHDPMSRAFFAEDQVAAIMMAAVALKSEKMAQEETI